MPESALGRGSFVPILEVFREARKNPVNLFGCAVGGKLDLDAELYRQMRCLRKGNGCVRGLYRHGFGIVRTG